MMCCLQTMYFEVLEHLKVPCGKEGLTLSLMGGTSAWTRRSPRLGGFLQTAVVSFFLSLFTKTYLYSEAVLHHGPVNKEQFKNKQQTSKKCTQWKTVEYRKEKHPIHQLYSKQNKLLKIHLLIHVFKATNRGGIQDMKLFLYSTLKFI